MLPVELRATWQLWRQRLVSRLEFWLVIIGYNRQKHGFDSPVYLGYVIVFFALWGFMVLTLLAGVAGQGLRALPLPPQEGALAAAVGILLVVFLVEGWNAARRSPFVFSEADAHHLVSTPVDRRFVGLLWSAEAWLVRGFFLWAVMIVLAYAVVEASATRPLTAADLPFYLAAGVRMLLVAIPLYYATHQVAWSVGARRLWEPRGIAWLRWAWAGLALAVAGAVFVAISRNAGGPFAWVFPLAFPLRGGLGAAPLLPGLFAALALAALAGGLLWLAGSRMSLALAAQETTRQEALEAASLLGDSDAVDALRQRERLGASHAPSRLPARPGLGALVWKHLVQESRDTRFSEWLSWLGIFSPVFGFWLLPDVGTRGWMIAFWLLALQGRVSRPLRRDLNRWVLFRQLPFASQQLVLADVIQPALLAAALSLLGLVLAGAVGLPVVGWAWGLAPASLPASLALALDVLQRSRSDRLLSGKAPEGTLLGIVYAGLALAAPALVGWQLSHLPALPAGLLVSGTAGLATWGLYRLVGWAMRKID